MYWGYQVKEKSNLFSLLSEWKGNVIITSRKGKTATKEQLEKYVKSNEPLLVVFGSPEKGVHEIIGGRMNKVQNSKSFKGDVELLKARVFNNLSGFYMREQIFDKAKITNSLYIEK